MGLKVGIKVADIVGAADLYESAGGNDGTRPKDVTLKSEAGNDVIRAQV